MTQRPNSKIFGLFEATQNSPNMTTVTTVKPVLTTSKPIINVLETNNEELIEIIDEINDIEMFLVAIMILLALILMFKIVKYCKKAYNMHNEKIILRHQNSSERL